ncbi:hypothetical protein Ddc_11443 [Ditylenchus destructor]|uniref:Uncharacterized protein n=1 Tax=Ditylenchus destructor TaxID=166010 RepID=A0AAD4NG51_9BILA|nr:hypothetical protein Ddc_11443 [Ditylenchus destructor]KAI1723733.1 hypothetical protein DdX_03904 [Ditylenchus destructor]
MTVRWKGNGPTTTAGLGEGKAGRERKRTNINSTTASTTTYVWRKRSPASSISPTVPIARDREGLSPLPLDYLGP